MKLLRCESCRREVGPSSLYEFRSADLKYWRKTKTIVNNESEYSGDLNQTSLVFRSKVVQFNQHKWKVLQVFMTNQVILLRSVGHWTYLTQVIEEENTFVTHSSVFYLLVISYDQLALQWMVRIWMGICFHISSWIPDYIQSGFLIIGKYRYLPWCHFRYLVLTTI